MASGGTAEDRSDLLKDQKTRTDTSFVEQAEKLASCIEINDDFELLLPSRRPIAEKELVKTLDLRLLPTIVLIFILNYIDRTAITAARLKGLESDLGLTDIQYSTVLAVLYVLYCSAQIPSNIILNRVSRPSWYISICVILWGLISALTGVARNYSGILATRIMIGFPEAAFYPGATYLLSRWYTRKELAFRSAILYGGLLLSNAFGSLIAAGILSNMEGKLGIRAWRWLFYIEAGSITLLQVFTLMLPQGAITICVGLIAVYVLPDYPHNMRWLSPAQKRLAQARLAEDTGEADEDTAEESIMHGVKLALKDPKVYIFALMTCSLLLGSSFVNFFPTLTATLGFSTSVSLLLAAPPWIFATLLCCVNAWHTDRSGERFFHITVPWWGTIVGYIICLSTSSVSGRYVGMFVMASGYAGFALTLVWVSNSIPRPPSKRSASIAIVNGIGNLGTLIGSYAWKVEWGPSYHPSMIIGIASLSLSSVLALAMRIILIAQNRKLEQGQSCDLSLDERRRIENAAKLEGLTMEEAVERRKQFRYLY